MPSRGAIKTRIIPVEKLGRRNLVSPIAREKQASFIKDTDCVIGDVHRSEIASQWTSGSVKFFELAGPRRKIYYNPKRITCGIVTCGGLCPGINDVIRAIVIELYERYGVKRVLGFRYGYLGLTKGSEAPPVKLDSDMVDEIHHDGGTILGSSRGPHDIDEMVDTLIKHRIDILFTIGGDGTMRGAMAIARNIKKRKLKISVVAAPKTIDNDIMYVRQSFGFQSAVEASKGVISCAHMEAKGAPNGIGLVKLMGRHSGFIAAYATLANSDVNICMIPEVPFRLEGKGGLLNVLEERLAKKRHVVIVVAEGAGQDIMDPRPDGPLKDASGNIRLKDIGMFLRSEIEAHFRKIGTRINLKYIDPSYTIRSVPANAMDSAFCLVLGQSAVHAAMSGRTNTAIGFENHHFTHVPISMAASERKTVNPEGRLWKTIMESALQPYSMFKNAEKPARLLKSFERRHVA
jgi:6-phosphofructokinase 1